MAESPKPITGGCLRGGLRDAAAGAPRFSGLCCCADCRKASGSGFIPSRGFAGAAIRFTGPTLRYRSPCFAGGDALRKACPTQAIVTRDRPDRLPLPFELELFETMPERWRRQA